MNATLTKVTVTVTQEHINRGAPGACTECAGALAIRDAMPDVWEADIAYGNDGESVIASVLFKSGRERWFLIDETGCAFVATFDAEDDERPVQPETFTMTELSEREVAVL
jgi:hypothetical protein